MAEDGLYPTQNGQELQRADAQVLGSISGIADDHVLAEFLRIQPYNGSVAKVVLPFWLLGGSFTEAAAGSSGEGTVSPSGSANGQINVWPFRAIAGSRNLPSAAAAVGPSGVAMGGLDSNALSSWRDIRSGVFVGGATQFYQAITLNPNSSGNPRWDLVYATIAPDSAGPSVSRRVKSAATGAVTVVSVPAYINSPVSVSVVTGTPGAVPALPSLPADSAGNYNLALGYVRVPNGFSSTSTVATNDIRSTIGSLTRFEHVGAGFHVTPGNGNNDGNNAAAASANVFNTSTHSDYYGLVTGHRPGVWMPPDWVGGGCKSFKVDNVASTSSNNWSHVAGSVLDSTIDWRNREFLCMVQAQTATTWDSDPAAGSLLRAPSSVLASVTVSYNKPVPFMGNTFGIFADQALATGGSTIWCSTATNPFALFASTVVGAYVDQTSGNLFWYVNANTPGSLFYFWIFYSAQMPNV